MLLWFNDLCKIAGASEYFMFQQNEFFSIIYSRINERLSHQQFHLADDLYDVN